MIQMAKEFGNAIKLARESGFDCVEVHAGHGYLISQFLSPYTNRRKDKYGGSLDNRMNFMRMCMNEVMEAAKDDMAIIAKTNMSDGFKGGNGIEEGIVIAKELEKLGVNEIYAYATHTENSILDREKGTLIKDLENNTVKMLFTTNSLFNGEHDKIVVIEV